MYGRIVVIKRTGADGAHFPLIAPTCKFGRSNDCDIRIQLPLVSPEHCRVDIATNGQAFVFNLCEAYPIKVNNKIETDNRALTHGDQITVTDRVFRFEYMPNSHFYIKSPKKSGQKTPSKILTPKGKPPTPGNVKSSSSRPLSPQSENVISQSPNHAADESTDKDKKIEENALISSQNKTTPSKSANPLDDLLDGLSPSTFYRQETPRKSLAAACAPVASVTSIKKSPKAASSKSPRKGQRVSPGKRVSVGSPYKPATSKELRKSMSDLRRKSQPLPEENLSPNSDQFKKRVSFGPQLSPEHFDKNLPPKTPVKKGATPRRSLPGRTKTPMSLLKRKSVALLIQEESSPDVLRSKVSPKRRSAVSTRGTPSKKAKAASPDNTRASETPENESPAKGKSPKEVSPASKKSPRSEAVSPKASEKSILQTPVSVRRIPGAASAKSTPATVLYPVYTSTATKRSPRSPATSPTSLVFGLALRGLDTGGNSSSPLKTTPARTTGKSPGVAAPVNSPSPKSRNKGPQQNVTESSKKSPRGHTSTPGKSQNGTPLSLKEKSHAQKSTPSTNLSPRKSSSQRRLSKLPVSCNKVTSPLSLEEEATVISSGSANKSSNEKPVADNPRYNVAKRRLSAMSPKETATSAPPAKRRKIEVDTPNLGGLEKFINISKVKPNAEVPTPSPTGLKRLVKTPKVKAAKLISPRLSGLKRLVKTPKLSRPAAELTTPSPTGIKRLVKTPKVKAFQAEVTTPSPAGLKHLVKTPEVKASTAEVFTPSPTGLKRLFKTFKLKASEAEVNTPSPAGLKRLVRTPKEKTFTRDLTPSPTGLKRIVKTPKAAAVQTSAPSPTGLKHLVKTPKANVSSVNSSDVPNLVKTSMALSSPHLSGVARMMKTPKVAKRVSASPSPTGLKRLMESPEAELAVQTPLDSRGNARPKVSAYCIAVQSGKKSPKSGKKTPISGKKTPKSKKKTPKSGKKTPKSGKKTPKSGMAGVAKLFHTPRSEAPAAKALTKSGKKALMTIAHMLSPAGQMVVPPPNINKIVALRAIHGRTITPSLYEVQRATGKVTLAKASSPKSSVPEELSPVLANPKVTSPKTLAVSIKPITPKVQSPPVEVGVIVNADSLMSTPEAKPAKKAATPRSVKKTPGRKLWSDIVKSSAVERGATKASPAAMRVIVKKKAIAAPRMQLRKSMPKTPRTVARMTAPSTGHADSPDTLVIGKMALGNRGKTPKSIRKSLSRKSVEVLGTPDHLAMYADLPDTPNGPGEMLVSPLVIEGCKSTSLVGVREMFLGRKSPIEADLSGIKRLVATPRSKTTASPILEGVARLMKTPKGRPAVQDGLSPGLQSIYASPPVTAKSPKMNTPASASLKEQAAVSSVLITKSSRQKHVTAAALKQSLADAASPDLSGVARLMKMPKRQSAVKDILSPTGLQRMFTSPAGTTELPKTGTPAKGVTPAKATDVETDKPIAAAHIEERSKKNPRKPLQPSVKRLARGKATSPIFSGVARLLKTPKGKVTVGDVLSPAGLQLMFASPVTGAVSPKKGTGSKGKVPSRAESPDKIADISIVSLPEAQGAQSLQAVAKPLKGKRAKTTAAVVMASPTVITAFSTNVEEVSPAKTQSPSLAKGPVKSGRGRKAASSFTRQASTKPARRGDKAAIIKALETVEDGQSTSESVATRRESRMAASVAVVAMSPQPRRGKPGFSTTNVLPVPTEASPEKSPLKTVAKSGRRKVTIVTPAKTPKPSPKAKRGRHLAVPVVVVEEVIVANTATFQELIPGREVAADKPNSRKTTRGQKMKPNLEEKLASPKLSRGRNKKVVSDAPVEATASPLPMGQISRSRQTGTKRGIKRAASPLSSPEPPPKKATIVASVSEPGTTEVEQATRGGRKKAAAPAKSVTPQGEEENRPVSVLQPVENKAKPGRRKNLEALPVPSVPAPEAVVIPAEAMKVVRGRPAKKAAASPAKKATRGKASRAGAPVEAFLETSGPAKAKIATANRTTHKRVADVSMEMVIVASSEKPIRGKAAALKSFPGKKNQAKTPAVAEKATKSHAPRSKSSARAAAQASTTTAAAVPKAPRGRAAAKKTASSLAETTALVDAVASAAAPSSSPVMLSHVPRGKAAAKKTASSLSETTAVASAAVSSSSPEKRERVPRGRSAAKKGVLSPTKKTAPGKASKVFVKLVSPQVDNKKATRGRAAKATSASPVVRSTRRRQI